MIFEAMSGSDPSLWLRPIPISRRADQWIAQAKFWARAVGVVCLFAGGAILLLADWNTLPMPIQFFIGLVWAAPAVVYIALSFFIARFHGRICLVLFYVALVQIIPTLAAPLLDRQSDFSIFQWYYLLAVALACGQVNLAFLAYQARRAMQDSTSTHDSRRGFDVLFHRPH